jgi:hypothetical protein
MVRSGIRRHFFNWDTWNTLCTADNDSGSWSLYATGPYHSRIRNGSIYRGANFPFTPNQLTPFIGDTFRYTWSLTWKTKGGVIYPHIFFYQIWASFKLCLIHWTFSSISLTMSGLKNHRSPGSDQFNGVQHHRPYSASNGAILILSW